MLPLSKELVEKVYFKVKEKYESLGKDKMSRFYHIDGVYKMASQLALIYEVDIYKAQICALLHDYYKYEDYKIMSSFLSEDEIKECEECKVLYHSYASSKQLKILFNINDKEMENAIKYHVFGHPNMTRLEKIILISDYTEENRKYEDCIKVRKILFEKGINQAIYESTLATINHLKNNNIEPHKLQLEVLNEYERKLKMQKIEVVNEALKKVNATNVLCYDTNEKSPFFSNVIVASVDSVRQLNASLEYIKEKLSEAGYQIKNTTGANSEWVIVDACDLLVHVFYKEERDRFQIDKLYLDSPVINLSE